MSNLTPSLQAILEHLTADPSATNEAVAAAIGSTPASVASGKSRLRALGHGIVRSGSSSSPRHSLGSSSSFGGESSLSNLASTLKRTTYPPHDELETLEECQVRIRTRFATFERMTRRLALGKIPSLIVSGPPGLGKSHTVEMVLDELFPDGHERKPDEADLSGLDDELERESDEVETAGQLLYDDISGTISAVGLYKSLWYCRNGGTVVLDDCDDVFRDETSLNLLKAVLDSKKDRKVSWRKEARWLEENNIPDRFTFRGQVIFLTNVDFEGEVLKGGKLAEHFKALMDRSMYLSLTLRSARDFMTRIRQVTAGDEGILMAKHGLTAEEAEEVLTHIESSIDRYYGLSIRLVEQAAFMYQADPDNWKDDLSATKQRSL